MAETMVSTTDLSRVVAAINDTSRKVSIVQGQAVQIAKAVDVVDNNVRVVHGNLTKLIKDFRLFQEEQRKSAALQRALTEIIRVRQELEQNFGNNKLVRDTMLGLLQATDTALVTRDTVSKVSEELMLSTPGYWLAPCLVAVAAWVDNQRDLADRAIKESMKRDPEKTALTMALICRRNKRIDTCQKWLEVYFSMQDARHMRREIVLFIECLVNGVFGPDKNDLCAGYINKWMKDITKNNPKFREDQVNYWRNHFLSYCKNANEEFPALAKVKEYDAINGVVGRINATAPIKTNFEKLINAQINDEELKNKIDEKLMNLVSEPEQKTEAPLREEETKLQLIKEYKGDEKKAEEVIKRRKALIYWYTQPVDLATHLSNTITNTGENSDVAAKKAAFQFLNGYIADSYQEFITENAPSFPESVSFDVDGWKGTVKSEKDKEPLQRSYEKQMRDNLEKKIGAVSDKPVKNAMTMAIVALIVAVVGLIMGIASVGFGWVLFAGGAIFTIVGFVKMSNAKKLIEQTKLNITNEMEQKIRAGKVRIANTVDQWMKAKAKVEGFYALPENKVFALKEA